MDAGKNFDESKIQRRLQGVTAMLIDSHEQLTANDARVCTTNTRVVFDLGDRYKKASANINDVVAIMRVYVNNEIAISFLFRCSDSIDISTTHAYKSDKFMSLTVGEQVIGNIYRINVTCRHNDRYALTIYSEDEYAQIPTFTLLQKDYALGVVSKLINECGVGFRLK